jgi:hypothetical protein
VVVVVVIVVVVVVLSDEALLHADAARPTAIAPRAASSLCTIRGYLR